MASAKKTKWDDRQTARLWTGGGLEDGHTIVMDDEGRISDAFFGGDAGKDEGGGLPRASLDGSGGMSGARREAPPPPPPEAGMAPAPKPPKKRRRLTDEELQAELARMQSQFDTAFSGTPAVQPSIDRSNREAPPDLAMAAKGPRRVGPF